jgi:hypothetical protein
MKMALVEPPTIRLRQVTQVANPAVWWLTKRETLKQIAIISTRNEFCIYLS